MIEVALISTFIGIVLGAAGTVALEIWAYHVIVGAALRGWG